ncbi:MAG TPA: arginine repressor [Actinobacteria bacterium]|nr:arginine repressor [Actinomycetota bacterium]
MDKRSRHRVIKEIVLGQNIATQEDLVEALLERGFSVTQATVSRDIAQIPLQKVRTGGGLMYHWQGQVAEPNIRLARMVREFVLSVGRSQNLVLLKTRPGTAQPVAASLDEAPLEPVLGTLAGDDTVLVVAKDVHAGGQAHEILEQMLEK